MQLRKNSAHSRDFTMTFFAKHLGECIATQSGLGACFPDDMGSFEYGPTVMPCGRVIIPELDNTELEYMLIGYCTYHSIPWKRHFDAVFSPDWA